MFWGRFSMNYIMILNVIASTSTEGQLTTWGAIFGIPTALATGFYILTYRFYRNTDKNYNYEKETIVNLSGLKTSDTKINTNNGTKERYIKGKNSDDHRSRVRRIQLDVTLPQVEEVPGQSLPKPPQSPVQNLNQDIPEVIPPSNA